MNLFPELIVFADASDEQLAEFISASEERVRDIQANPDEFVTDEFTVDDLVSALQAGVEALESARAESATRATAAVGAIEPTDALATIDALATEALSAEAEEPADEPVETDEESATEPEAEAAAAVEEPATPAVTAGGGGGGGGTLAPLAPPARAPRSAPQVVAQARVSLTASAPNLGFEVGQEIDGGELARMMIERRRHFGRIAEGTHGEQIALGQFDWRDVYGEERTLDGDVAANMAKIDQIIDANQLRAELARRAKDGLVASGGLCAPVTPYYDLAMVSVAERPVRAALPAFNATRGGIRFAAPATLADVTTGVGYKTAEDDGAGGTFATKTCQVIPCPDFSEVDVAIIYHCLQFGNLGARTFPELVAQWNNLVMAAHARVAERALLTGIDDASTAVTAGDLGLGASATIPSQILTAAAGMRSRHRMAPDAVLRTLLPRWVLDLLVSDVYRSQFQRFDITPERFVAILRAGGVEPSFYIDSADGAGQEFGTQSPGTLDAFPAAVRWYLFPEGSFLYLDGGTLELGLVRDSVLNETNDFQIFGESFENVAFTGVESLAVTTAVCDSGAVSEPVEVTTCGSY